MAVLNSFILLQSFELTPELTRQVYNNSLNKLGFFLGWILVEEMVIFTQNFIELLYIVIPLLYIRYWNPHDYGQWTTPRDAFPIRIRKRKASGKLIETVSDWLRSLPQKGKLLALKLNQMNP